MHFPSAFSPSVQYSTPPESESAQQLTGSPYGKVSQSPHVMSNLESDVKLFMGIVKKKIGDRNIVVSPLLISTAENTTTKLLGLQIPKESNISEEPDSPPVQSSPEKIHVFSKTIPIDMALEQLGIPFTSSRELEQQGYDNATQRLNEQIAKDTNGVITNLLDPETLKNPATAYQLVSWLFQNVSWQEPFMVIPQGYRTDLTWNGEKQPEIVWMESGRGTNLIAYKNISNFEFIAMPVKESGLKAVFIMPPKWAQQEHSDEVSNILTKGLNSLFNNQFTEGYVGLYLPKYQFDYVYEEDYPELLGSGKHKANLSINEAGAYVAASFQLLGGGIPQQLIIDRPFYFAMINHENSNKPRLAGIAYIKQPWG